MNYAFLIRGDLDRGRLAVVLADGLRLPVESVDVGDDGDDDRNWDAPVSCTVTHLAGDLPWHLDVYVGPAVVGPPPEWLVARRLSDQLRVLAAIPAAPSPPSAYWLAAPGGKWTRARIYEGEGDVPEYRIAAVERPVAAVPWVPVMALPEAIRSYRMPTPRTDRLREELQPWLAADDEIGAAVRAATNGLGAWESMINRLLDGWPPDLWYPAGYYREDLETRDELAAVIETLPEPAKDPITQALAEVDRKFAEATEEDGGLALAAATEQEAGHHWWWHRIPHPVPWQYAPGI